MRKRNNLEISAGSMADIAFLLLVFFLVTTDMETNKGIAATLPPPKEDTKTEIKKRNVLEVHVNKFDELLVNGNYMPLDSLYEFAKEFIANKEGLAHLP